jgi:hypothetical protein
MLVGSESVLVGSCPPVFPPSDAHDRVRARLARAHSLPGAFTMAWNAGQRYRRDQRKEEVPLHEMVCAENNEDHFNQGLVPIPQADKTEF